MMPWELAELSYNQKVALVALIGVRIDAEAKQKRELDRLKK